MGDKREAMVLNIQKLSTEDGPGLRTTVFFKGCPLNCSWCQNPESISGKQEIEWLGSRCMGCHICLNSCPSGALSTADNEIRIHREKCSSCYMCAENCPTLAIELKGKKISLDTLYEEIIKDKAYYDAGSQGGVTLSGGEVLLQADFAESLLRRLKGIGIHTAIDTCGLCSRETLDKVIPYTDLFLFDLKLMDALKHKEYTGVSNEKILSNLVYLSKILSTYPTKKLWIRTPIIPDYTDSFKNIKEIAEFIQSQVGQVVERWELCTFNNLCRDKYERLGRVWAHDSTPLVSQLYIEQLVSFVRDMGFDNVYWSGITTCHKKEEVN